MKKNKCNCNLDCAMCDKYEILLISYPVYCFICNQNEKHICKNVLNNTIDISEINDYNFVHSLYLQSVKNNLAINTFN